jgi:bifunctional enzyme CysN/CysC
MARTPKKPIGNQDAKVLSGHEAETAIESYLHAQEGLDLLRFITCGSVDDGKSTLIGRLLWESKNIFDDQVAALKKDSIKHGTQGKDIDFALLVDGLTAEREQGITIDVAYRFFATDKRKFIVADTPGHEQFTRNMVTGASTADVAIILVNARNGLMPQTRRHAYLVSLVGIKHVVLAVNKMDLCRFQQSVFNDIVRDFNQFAGELKFESVTAIPLSALAGDNITQRSTRTPWYGGPTLIGFLETIAPRSAGDAPFSFPVQWVNRPHQDFRGYAGTVAGGELAVGDSVRAINTGETAKVARIVTFDGDLPHATVGQSVTLVLDKEIELARGDVLCPPESPLQTTDQFEATLVWMGEEAGLVGRTYELKSICHTGSVSITQIKYCIDVNTLGHEARRTLRLNDIGVCNLSTTRPFVFGKFAELPAFGSFILIDRFSNHTVAAGFIRHSLRRSQNIFRHSHAITRAHREALNGHPAKVIWFTGLSGSGKSTLADALEKQLSRQGIRTYILDGDNVRHGLNKDLGFTDADRVENIRRVAEVAKLMVDAGLVVITAFISPFRSERQMARDMFEPSQFIEVHMNVPLEIAEARDAKGLYRKARRGELPNFTGIDSAYEAPEAAEISTNADDSVEAATKAICSRYFA